MEPRRRAGSAAFNDGSYAIAADIWSGALDDGRSDETSRDNHQKEGTDPTPGRLCEALSRTAGAIVAARTRKWDRAQDRARRALAGLDASPSPDGLELAPLRAYAAVLRSDPAVVERRRPSPIFEDGTQIRRSDLGFEATAVAARALARARGDDIERGIGYAKEDVANAVVSSPFVALVFDYVRDSEHRGLVVERLSQHADRRQAKDDDVAGLFDPP